MSLPKFPARRETVEIDGEFIAIRSLTRHEQAQFQKMVAAGVEWDELEMAVIAAGTETELEEVRDWYRATPGDVAERLSTAIRVLSGLDGEAQKSG